MYLFMWANFHFMTNSCHTYWSFILPEEDHIQMTIFLSSGVTKYWTVLSQSWNVNFNLNLFPRTVRDQIINLSVCSEWTVFRHYIIEWCMTSKIDQVFQNDHSIWCKEHKNRTPLTDLRNRKLTKNYEDDIILNHCLENYNTLSIWSSWSFELVFNAVSASTAMR